LRCLDCLLRDNRGVAGIVFLQSTDNNQIFFVRSQIRDNHVVPASPDGYADGGAFYCAAPAAVSAGQRAAASTRSFPELGSAVAVCFDRI
jgi:hypothetical protein